MITLVKGYARAYSYICIKFPTQMLDMPTCAQMSFILVPIQAIKARSTPTKALSQHELTATLEPRYRCLEVIPPYQATVSSHDLCLCV